MPRGVLDVDLKKFMTPLNCTDFDHCFVQKNVSSDGLFELPEYHLKAAKNKTVKKVKKQTAIYKPKRSKMA